MPSTRDLEAELDALRERYRGLPAEVVAAKLQQKANEVRVELD